MERVPTVMGAIGMDSSTRVLADGNSDVAIPGDIVGTDAKSFRERYPIIEDPAPFLRCRYTGVIYPNQFPFNQRSDMLEPCWAEPTITPPVPVEKMAEAVFTNVPATTQPVAAKKTAATVATKRGKGKRTRATDSIEVTHEASKDDGGTSSDDDSSDADEFSDVAL